VAIVDLFDSAAERDYALPAAPGAEDVAEAGPEIRPAALVARFSFALAGLLAGFVVYVFVLSGFGAGRAQTGLQRRFEVPLRQGRAPVGGQIAPGSPVARLDIASLGLHQIVVEGTTSAQLQVGPGHVAASPLPGQVGNAVIAGHRLAYGGPFSHLADMRPGAHITVVTGQGRFSYRVTRHYVTGADDLQPFEATRDNRLTLVTAADWTASHRLVLVAALDGTAKPFAAGRSRVLGRADGGLVGQSGDMSALALWTLILVLVAAGSVSVYRRLPRSSSYLATTPVILLAAWLVYTNLGRVLPATL
jgi:sortase A